MKPIAAALAIVVAAATGCTSGPTLDPDTVQALSQMVRPADAPVGEDLDIVVTREGGAINLANRTPRSYENVQLWLNQQYVGIVDRIEISPSNQLPLSQFINKHGESFPVAGFLSPDRAAPVVAAELFLPDEQGNLVRHALNVRFKIGR